MARSIVLACLVGLTLIGARDFAAASDVLSIPSNAIPTAPSLQLSPRPLTGRLYLPGTAGPYPVIILLHGCGGIGSDGSHEEHWADRLNGWGYAALVVDSLHPRGMTEVCSSLAKSRLNTLDRAGDAINAALAVGGAAGVDAQRIGVVGFSHGGSSAVMLTQQAFVSFRPRLIKGSVDYYGACYFPQDHGAVPLLVLAGGADTLGNAAQTCTTFAAAQPPDRAIDLVIYPDVYHEFDNPFFRARAYSRGVPLQYDGDAASDSFARIHAFLDRYVMHAK